MKINHFLNHLIYFWGKTSKKENNTPDVFHPVIYHLIDVGFVAASMLKANSLNTLDKICEAFDIKNKDSAISLVAFLIALHDIGKVSPSFESKDEYLCNALKMLGIVSFDGLIREKFYHQIESYRILLKQQFDFIDSTQETRNTIALCVGSHHGSFCSATESASYPETDNKKDWQKIQQEMINSLIEIFQPISIKLNPQNQSVAGMLLNGITILADWLGSNEYYFPPSNHIPIEKYIPVSQTKAKKIVADKLIGQPIKWEQNPTFAHLFPNIKSPRGLQLCADVDNLPVLPKQFLAFVEASTGSGKTELALMLASRMQYEHKYSGFYHALPTIATSVRIFEDRFLPFIRHHAKENKKVQSILINGQSDEINKLISKNLDFYINRKKSMLVPYGVGTVDQLMMAALNTRHGSLRITGLTNKVIIIDEVHAYDSYMTTIIERLLEWLKAINCSVIMLSATLPLNKKQQLIKAWSGKDLQYVDNSYPLITIVEDDKVNTLKPTIKEIDKKINIKYLIDNESNKSANIQYLLNSISDGGCAAYICNTIKGSQDAFDIANRLKSKDTAVFIYHARYNRINKKTIENLITEKFGVEKNRRPKKSLVIATQVIEQSLDLDFDIIMTQLCPIDLLIQRIGRLFRHLFFKDTKQPIIRPPKLQTPNLILLMPEIEGEKANFGYYDLIYDHNILYRTMAVLHNRSSISTPSDLRWLIDTVYSDKELEYTVSEKTISEALKKSQANIANEIAEAKTKLLASPSTHIHFNENKNVETDDSEEFAKSQTDTTEFESKTRNIKIPTVPIVLLSADDLLYQEIMSNDKISDIALSQIQDNIVNFTNGELHKHVKARKENNNPTQPKYFEKIAALKNIHILLLTNGAYTWFNSKGTVYTIRYDTILGGIVNVQPF